MRCGSRDRDREVHGGNTFALKLDRTMEGENVLRTRCHGQGN